MKVKLSIGCTLEEADKERIPRLFKEHNISLAGWVRDKLREQVDKWEEKK